MKQMILALVVAALSTAPAPAQPETGSDDPEDGRIRAAIEAELKKDDIEDQIVDIQVRERVATLTGRVRNLWTKNKAIEAALRVDGLEAIESDIEIAMPESDQALGQQVVNEVLSYPRYGIFDDVVIGIEEGAVLLSGAVTQPIKKTEIGERVSKLLGVQELHNQIKVLPVSPSDDRIREALAQRIYRDPMFIDLGQRAHPPIHIIVENGHVILTGAVRSRVESRKAETLARTAFGVFGVENRLQVSP